MVTGRARKSTHKKPTKSAATKKAKTVPGAPKEHAVVQIDNKKKYEISAIGPVHLAWGKKRVKNSKGKIVKEYYIKKDTKHLIWVKWSEPFEDDHEKKDEYWTKWSAEPQEVFEGSHMKAAVKEVLEKKVIWPWVRAEDELSEDRRKILKGKGYKEWKDTKKTNDKRWHLKMALEVQTDRSSSNNSDSDSESTTSANEVDNEEEEDEV